MDTKENRETDLTAGTAKAAPYVRETPRTADIAPAHVRCRAPL
jgi:hypothetical protein